MDFLNASISSESIGWIGLQHAAAVHLLHAIVISSRRLWLALPDIQAAA